MLIEMRITNADVLIRDNIDEDQLIDVIASNKVYMPVLIVLNKTDLVSQKKLSQVKSGIKPDLCISAEKNMAFQRFKQYVHLCRMFQARPPLKF